MKKKNVVVGLGEIGNPIYDLISKSTICVGYDINKKLINTKKFEKYKNFSTLFLHVCIPFSNNFQSHVKNLHKQFNSEIIVIHSTIKPKTINILQQKFSIPIIYSATRGIHRRMSNDIKRYTKFFALESNAPRRKWAELKFTELMRNCKIKTKKMSDPLTLELAKIVCDTSYYGWLINYAQLSNLIAIKNNVNYDEMWSFSDEIHKFLGNRPKFYPGFIGGHCVIPNLDLIDDDSLYQIDTINKYYNKKVKNAKQISKKFENKLKRNEKN